MSAFKELKDIEICSEARKWINEHPNKTLQELWDICHRGDWMIYLLSSKYSVPTSIYKEMAWEFAANVIPYAGETKDVCIEMLDVISQFLNGECSLASFAYAYASSSYAYADAAASAVSASAASSAYAYAAAVSASAAAAIYTYAVSAAAASAAAVSASSDAIQCQQARIIRYFVPKLSEVSK